MKRLKSVNVNFADKKQIANGAIAQLVRMGEKGDAGYATIVSPHRGGNQGHPFLNSPKTK